MKEPRKAGIEQLEPLWLGRLGTAIVLASLCLVVLALVWPGQRFFMTPFRESQTAITAYYMQVEGAGLLRPPLPVFGQPWMMPLEFPLFQKLVSLIPFGWVSPDKAGRFASLFCYLAAACVLRALLAELGVSPFYRRLAVALFLSCPVYLCYAGAYLIESFVLLLALTSLYGLLRWWEDGSWLFWGLSLVAGILCALSKPTTWAAVGLVLLALGVRWLFNAVCTRSWNISQVMRGVLLGALAVVPVVCYGLWEHHSDTIKTENPFTTGMTARNLAAWNYGTLGQKSSPVVWFVILCKNLLLLFGPLGLLVPAILVYAVYVGRRLKLDGYWSIALAVALYLAIPVVFTNLHFRHDYYLYANGVYLTVAVALACELLWRAGRHRLAVGSMTLLLLSTLIGSCGYLSVKRVFHDRIDDRLIECISKIDTPGPVAYLGFGFPSFVPYYTMRKALMIGLTDPQDELLQAAIRRNRDQGFAAVVSIDPCYDAAAKTLAEGLGIAGPVRLEFFPGASLWISEEQGRRLRAAMQDLSDPVLDEIQARVKPLASLRNGVVYWRIPFVKGRERESGFVVIVKRVDDAFYFRSRDWSFYRIRRYFRGVEPER